MHLIKRIATVLSDRETSLESYACCIAPSPHEHQGHAEGRLKMHLGEPAKSGGVESEDRAFGPTMTFRQQGHCEENRRGSGCKSDADIGVSISAKAPFQGRPNIVDGGDVRRPRLAGRKAWPFDSGLLQPS